MIIYTIAGAIASLVKRLQMRRSLAGVARKSRINLTTGHREIMLCKVDGWPFDYFTANAFYTLTTHSLRLSLHLCLSISLCLFISLRLSLDESYLYKYNSCIFTATTTGRYTVTSLYASRPPPQQYIYYYYYSINKISASSKASARACNNEIRDFIYYYLYIIYI